MSMGFYCLVRYQFILLPFLFIGIWFLYFVEIEISKNRHELKLNLFPRELVFDSVNASLPKVALAISTCFQQKIQFEKFGLPYYLLKCNMETNKYDCKEAVPYLNFIIENYDHPKAERIIFIHDHVKSWHCFPDIYTIIKNLTHSKEFYEMDYGSINHFFYQQYPNWGPKTIFPYYHTAFQKIFKDTAMMKYYDLKRMWFACCASFFVNSKLFRTRPKQFYEDLIVNIRNYIKANPVKGNDACSKILEFTWHIIFTDDPFVHERNYTLIETGEVWSRTPPMFHHYYLPYENIFS